MFVADFGARKSCACVLIPLEPMADFDHEPPQTLKLMEYDPVAQLKPTYTVVLFGPRGSGKTVMMRYFLKAISKKLDMAVAFIPTSDTRKDFEEHLPRCFVYPEFDLEAFKRILDSQHRLNELVDDAETRSKSDGTFVPFRVRNVGIIMDDCMFNKKSTKSEEMRWLFMNGRHDKLFHMNAVQYIMDIGMDIRSNIDVVVAFPTSNPGLVTRLRENLLTCFDKDEDLLQVFMHGIQENEALVFDRRAYERKEPYLFYCKAEYPISPFRVGNDTFWEMYYKHLVRRSTAVANAHIFNTLQVARDKPDDICRRGGKKVKAKTNIMRIAKPKAGQPPRMALLPS
jgi:hypothetical protein